MNITAVEPFKILKFPKQITLNIRIFKRIFPQ